MTGDSRSAAPGEEKNGAGNLPDRAELLAKAFAEAAQAIVVIDPVDGRFVEFNDVACHARGYTREEFAALRVVDLHLPELREKVGPNLQQTIALGSQTLEVRHVTKQGEVRDIQINARSLHLRGRDYIVAVWTDLTERNRIAEELAAARNAAEQATRELSAVFDAMPAAVLISHDVDSVSITGNRVAEDLLNIPANCNISKSASDLAPAHFVVIRDGRQVPAAELPLQRAARGEVVRDFEHSVVFDDGRTCTLLGDAVPLLDAAGRPRGSVGAFVDITERKRTEDALRESLVHLTETQRITGVGTWEVDLVQDQLSWSRQTFAIFGLPAPASAPTNPTQLWRLEPAQRELFRASIYPEDRARMEAAYTDSIQQHRPYEIDHRVLLPDGRVRFVREACQTFYSADGTPERSLGTVLDLTTLYETRLALQANEESLERERALSELKSQFVSIASHELRTPLTAVVGNLGLLERYGDRATPEKRTQLMGRMKQSLVRLTQIMDDLLLVSRAEAGRVTVQPAPVDLVPFIREAIQEVEEGDHQAHRFQFEPMAPQLLVPTDARILSPVVVNLLSNAVKYSPADSTVHVSLTSSASQFVITVADEGIGIPEADRARLFEPFVRASNVGAISGTGLGLSIVKLYTGLLHGRVALLPSERGAVFRVEIPLLVV